MICRLLLAVAQLLICHLFVVEVKVRNTDFSGNGAFHELIQNASALQLERTVGKANVINDFPAPATNKSNERERKNTRTPANKRWSFTGDPILKYRRL